MHLIVKTENGFLYEFTQNYGRTFFRRGVLTGEVIRINSGPISIGKGINMEFRKYGLYGTLDKQTTFENTSPVSEIYVTL